MKLAFTGPSLTFTTAEKCVSSSLLSCSQPGMQAFSTSGSLSLAQTTSLLAGSVTSPFIVIAMAVFSQIVPHSAGGCCSRACPKSTVPRIDPRLARLSMSEKPRPTQGRPVRGHDA
ncbi:hypothetical protein ABIE41_002720 [Bosea sp. OAE506]